MKTLLTLITLVAVPAFCQPATQEKKTPQKKVVTKAAKKPAPPTVKPLVIPKDATPNPDGTYAWADKSGKKWIFSKTPFGISKIEDTGASRGFAPAAQDDQYVKAIDAGDKVRFERQSPFGTTKWEKNKADLTDDERAILARQQQASQK